MPLLVPDLDDKTFDQLVAAARSLIPRNEREWTDHNPSDPGIALLELFAYYTETAIYQLNRIPDTSSQAFLRLVGIDTGGDAGDRSLSDPATRALDELAATHRAVTGTELEELAVQIADRLATPVTATDGSGKASVLVTGIPAGTAATDIDVRDRIFDVGQTIDVGHPPVALATTIVAVNGGRLTLNPGVTPAVHFLEAAARAQLALFVDAGCAPPGRPQVAPLATLVVVVPDRPDDPAPVPTVELTDALFRELLRHRVLATRIHAVAPVYVPVTVDITVTGKTGDSHLRPAEVEAAVRTWLSPLTGGPTGSGWPFGRDVYVSELSQLIESLGHVDHVDRLTLRADAPGVATEEGVAVPPFSLVEARSVVVRTPDEPERGAGRWQS
jgi:hypothetical protein